MNAVTPKSAMTLTLTAAFVAYAGMAQADRVDRSLNSVPSITISYAELDISKPQGLQVLYTRLERAAKTVCDFDYAPRDLARVRSAKACYQSALENAVNQINRPTLTALHRAKMKSTFG